MPFSALFDCFPPKPTVSGNDLLKGFFYVVFFFLLTMLTSLVKASKIGVLSPSLSKRQGASRYIIQ